MPGAVADVAEAQGAGGEGVAGQRHGRFGAGNHTALEVCVASHLDLEATIPRLDTALLGDRGVVAVDIAFAGAEAATF